jgi:hypothetical protein
VEVVVLVAGGRLARLRGAQWHVAERVPLPQHAARLDVDLLHDRIQHDSVLGSPDRGEVGPGGLIDGDQRGALGRDLKLVQVGVVALAPVHGRDPLVRVIVDHVLPEPMPGGDPSLPPGHDGLAPIALLVDVVGHGALGHRVEPHQPPPAVEDHRPILGPGCRAQEHVTRTRVRIVSGHDRDRRAHRAGMKALRRRWVGGAAPGGSGRHCARRRRRDREREVERGRVRHSRGGPRRRRAERRADRHPLAGRERTVGHERASAAVRQPDQPAGV